MTRTTVVLAAVALFVANGCAADGPDGPTTPVQTLEPPTPDGVAASGVGVVAEGCSLVASLGSGVVVETSGQVATAAHTLRGASDITVIDAGGDVHEATVVGFDKDADLALLDTPTLGAPPLPIGAATIGPGTLVTWRRADGVTTQPVDVTRLLNITIEDIYSDEVVQRSGLEIDGDVAIGQSGGPVVNDRGEAIGIVYAASKEREAVGFATDDAELRELVASRSASGVDNGRCP